MTSLDHLYSSFIDAWNAGERPRVRDYLERADPTERMQLAETLEDWLELAPTPQYSEAARAAIRSEPAVQRALAAALPLLSQELPRLRARRSLTVRELASRVVAAVGLAGGQLDQTEDYLQRAERGELDPSRFSQRLLDALGAALEVPSAALVNAARSMPAAAAPAVSFRTDGNQGHERAARDFNALTAAARAPSPRALDDVDLLFLGGRDA